MYVTQNNQQPLQWYFEDQIGGIVQVSDELQ